MSYEKSEMKIDCMLNGTSSLYKIQNLYEEIKLTCGLRLKKPFNDRRDTSAYSNSKDSLYGMEMYHTSEAMITFKIYGFFDVINQKMIDNTKDPSKKYVSATRMEIIINTKNPTLVERINEIIAQYPSQAASVANTNT
jgi:hypothetical protein